MKKLPKKKLTKKAAVEAFEARASDTAMVSAYQRHAADLSSVYSFRCYPVESKAEIELILMRQRSDRLVNELLLRWADMCIHRNEVCSWANPEEYFDGQALARFVNDFVRRGPNAILDTRLNVLMQSGLTYQILSTVCTAPEVFNHERIDTMLAMQNILQNMQYQSRLAKRNPFNASIEYELLHYISFFDPLTGMVPTHFSDKQSMDEVMEKTNWRPFSCRIKETLPVELYLVNQPERNVLRLRSVAL